MPSEAPEGSVPKPDEELTGQVDLDEQLAKPVLDGTVGIEAAQVWIGGFLVLIAVLIAYSNSFSIPLQFPDRQVILQNSAAQSLTLAPLASKNTGIPLVPMMTIAMNWWFAPGSAVFFHIVNVGLHALTGVLVYLLARRLLRLNRGREPGQEGPALNEPIAMLGGLLVALHPLATESVNLVIGRTSLLCAVFAVSAILLFLRASDREGEPGIGALIGSGICFGLAWACDITALFVPAFILMADWIANGSAAVKRLPVHAAFWGIAIAFGVWWMTVANLDKDPYAVLDPEVMVPPPVKAVAFSRGMALSVTPTSLTIEQDLPPAAGFLDPDEPGARPFVAVTTGAGLLLVALILVAVRSAAGLGLAWFVLALAPVAYFVPPHSHFTERSLYFGLCGLGLILPWVVSKTVAKRAAAIAGGLASVALLLAAASGTYLRNVVWQDEIALWEDAAVKSPGAPEPYRRLGAIYHDAGQRAFAEFQQLARDNQRPAAMKKREEAQSAFGKAMSFLQQAVEIDPNDAKLRNLLGITLAVMNKRDEAIAMLTEALRLDPSLQECAVQLGALYGSNPADPVNTEGKQRALDYYQRAARLGPMTPEQAVGYAAALARVGNIMGAAQVLAPYASDPQSMPAAMLKQMQPAVDTATAMQQKAIEAEKTAPAAPETAKLRIQAMLEDGQTLSAFYQLDRYLKFHPDDAEAWLMMGLTRARVGEADAFLKEYAGAPAVKEGETPIWMQLARQCAEQGRWEAARAYLEFAATQSPDVYAKPLLKLGELAIELHQPSVAVTLLDGAAKADDKDPAPWLLLCDIALESKNDAQARRYLDEAERLGADPAAVAPRRAKAGVTTEEEKKKSRSILQ